MAASRRPSHVAMSARVFSVSGSCVVPSNRATAACADAAVALFRRSLALKPDQPGAIRSLEMLEKGLPAGPGKH